MGDKAILEDSPELLSIQVAATRYRSERVADSSLSRADGLAGQVRR